MKTKLLMFVAIFSILTTLTMTSATSYNTDFDTITLTKFDSSKTIDFSNPNPELINITWNALNSINADGKIIPISITPAKLNDLNVSSGSKSLTISALSIPSNLNNGVFTAELFTYVEGNQSDNKTIIVRFSNELKDTYCELGNIGDLEIKDIEFTNNGFNDKVFGDDDEWTVLDEIEVTIEVKNNGDEDIDDVVISWALYDKNANEIILDEEEDLGDIKDGDKEELTFTINLDPDDFDSDYDEEDFVFIVKVYSDDLGEEEQCIVEEVNDFKILKDDNFVVLAGIEESAEIPCNGLLDLSGTLWNIGEDDEEDVIVRIYNTKLGIDEEISVGDIDVLEDKRFTYSLKIPSDAEEGNYNLIFEILDEDGDVFENNDDKKSQNVLMLKVAGNCQTSSDSNIQISAILDSSTPKAIAGEQMIVQSRITNLGNTQIEVELSILGNSAWSTLGAIDPQTLIIPAGESKTANIYFNIDKDSSGENQFTIRAAYSGVIKEQQVAINIEQNKYSGIIDHFRRNWFIYLIILVNIILILIIIAILRRIFRRRPSEM